MKKVLGLVLGAMLSSTASAGVILQADNVWTDGVPYNGPIENVINQSGLSANYTSGVDDFETFVNGTTASFGSIASALGDTSAPLDNYYFDLGALYTIDALAIWNQWGSASLKTFDILSSSDASFTTTSLLGSYSIADGSSVTPGYMFNFSDTSAQYFMIDVTSNYGFPDATRINEVAFSGVSAVPEPSSLALMALGLAGVGFVARRRKA